MPTIQELVTDIAQPPAHLTATVSPTERTPFYFDANIARYKTCCRCMHLTTCTYLVGVIEIVVMLFFILDAILIWFRSGSEHTLQLSLCTAGVVLGLIAVLLLFLSLCYHKPQMMIPHVVMQALTIILLLVLTVLCIVTLVVGTSVLVRIINRSDSADSALHDALLFQNMSDDISTKKIVSSYLKITLIFFALFFFLLAVFQVWALSIVLRTYQYMKMKIRYDKVERNGRVVISDPIGPLETDRLKRH